MNSDTQLLIRATLKLYGESAQKATQAFMHNWIVLIGAIIAFIAAQQINSFLSVFGLTGNFLAGLINVLLLSYYYSWISRILEKELLTLNTMRQPDMALFLQIISVSFIIWLVEFVLRQFLAGGHGMLILTCAHLIMVILFNAVPEILYIHRYDGMLALERTATFIKENWIEWYIPLLILVMPCVILSPSTTLTIFARTDVLLPASFIPVGFTLTFPFAGFFSFYTAFYLALFLGVILAHWYMLFRGFLFKGLESGTRRRRIFQMRGG